MTIFIKLENCGVCNKEIKKELIIKENFIITQCFHHFHYNCFVNCLYKDDYSSGLCPFCRNDLHIPKNEIHNSKEIIRKNKLTKSPK